MSKSTNEAIKEQYLKYEQDKVVATILLGFLRAPKWVQRAIELMGLDDDGIKAQFTFNQLRHENAISEAKEVFKEAGL